MKNLMTIICVILLILLGCGGSTPIEPEDFMVDGSVALASLIALGDGHLQQIANHFQMLASTDDVRSADWERIRGPLDAVEDLKVRALLWFALPDGSYWSVQEGKAAGNLSDRNYWPRLMNGQIVIGDLVVSRATGRSTAIVAVPVHGAEGAIVGVLGSSVYLDSLSIQIKREMDLQPHQIFYSIDSTPVVGLHNDPELIFLYPLEEGNPELERAILRMLSREEGVISYSFRGVRRTVLYRKSHVSSWWYAFGVLK